MRRYTPLSDDSSKLLLNMLSHEKDKTELPEAKEYLEESFLWRIISKRISVAGLPISFNLYASIAVHAFVDRPGSAVLLLIDCLNRFEGKEVTVSDLCNLYPDGFYDEDTLVDIIDNELNTRKMPWSEIY